MKKASYLLFILLFSGLALSSCSAARKAKKCDCPTFGNTQEHSPAILKNSEKDS
jgi:hypothetical protein